MSVTSPYDICTNEQLRRHFRAEFDWGPSIPVDVFIMADGEPENRWVTKFGGLPYRPANRAWPTDKDGAPLIFLAQFDFSDSLDITGKLPGDVLLIFNWKGGFDFDEYPPHFEWQSLGCKNLIEAAAIPYQKPFDPCYGHIFRTVNYPQAEQSLAFPTIQENPRYDGKVVYNFGSLSLYNASQIGLGYVGQTGSEDTILPGRLLCTVADTTPTFTTPYPFVNFPEPIPLPNWTSREAFEAQKKYLSIGDLGGIYISMDQEGKLHANYTYN